MPTSLYEQLLSAQRLNGTRDKRLRAEESLSDRMRIVNCSAFRRLGGKAQVFSLARAGTVRTRLTHSFEVATYGQLIATKVVDELTNRDKNPLPSELRQPFVQTVENACLMHDIGNPPFGHMCEYAIHEWDDQNEVELGKAWMGNNEPNGTELAAQLAAFKNFEGTPQGLRIVTRLQWFDHKWGLNR